MPQTFQNERERGRPKSASIRRSAVLVIAVDDVRTRSGSVVTTRPQTAKGEQRPEGSTPSSHCRTWILQKSSATMAQLAMPNCREAGGFGSHSLSFDHRFRPDTLRTAMATAFFCPTSTTSFLPRVTPV